MSTVIWEGLFGAVIDVFHFNLKLNVGAFFTPFLVLGLIILKINYEYV